MSNGVPNFDVIITGYTAVLDQDGHEVHSPKLCGVSDSATNVFRDAADFLLEHPGASKCRITYRGTQFVFSVEAQP